MPAKKAVKKKQPKIYGTVTGTNLPRTRDKVAIVGFAPSSMGDVQFLFGKPDWEIWPLNQLYMAFPPIVEHATRWFQIHHRHTYDQTISRDHSHHEWLSKQTRFPIYMQRHEPDIPMSVPFPVNELLTKFRRYFTNSISWMIALAIWEKFSTIAVYGVDMAQDSEHMYERPSVEYFMGYAEGAGSKLVLPEKSDLLKSMFLYPFEDSAPFRTKISSRRNELRNRIQQFALNEQGAHDSRMQLVGAVDNMNYILQSWEEAQHDMEGFKVINENQGMPLLNPPTEVKK
jgi:hypothetical protein